MVTHTCNNCNKTFEKKSNYNAHINRKNPCINKSLKIFQNIPKSRIDESKIFQNGINELSCSYCKKSYSTYSNKIKHTRSCKIKKNDVNQKEELYQNLLNEMKILVEQNKELKEKIDKIDVKGQNIVNTHNIQINNSLLAFGNEDLSHLSSEVCKQILNLGYRSIPKLIEKVHFNEDKPENANVYISNIKDPYVMVYNGKKWTLQYRDQTISELLESKGDYLEDCYDELIKSLDSRTKRRFERFLNKKDDDEVVDRLKKEIKLLLYNHKDIPLKQIKNKEIKYLVQ
jgi:hypothetical protein